VLDIREVTREECYDMTHAEVFHFIEMLNRPIQPIPEGEAVPLIKISKNCNKQFSR
jgi:hypothetical protein